MKPGNPWHRLFHRLFSAAPLLMLVLLAAGCAQSIQVPVQLPAASGEAMNLRTVTVTEIENDARGTPITEALERYLINLKVDRKPWFSVKRSASYRRPDRYEALHRIRSPGHAIYAGKVTLWETPTRRYSVEEEECVVYEDPDAIFSDCLEYRTVQVPCVERAAEFALVIEVIEAASRQAVHSVEVAGSESDSGCGSDTYSVMSSEVLMSRAQSEAYRKLDCQFAPCIVHRELELMDDNEGLSPQAAARFDAALDMANNNPANGFLNACSEWIKIHDVLGEETVSLLYNVAICYEANAEYDQAVDALNRARNLSPGFSPEIQEALARLQRGREDAEILQRQKSGRTSEW